MDTAKAELKRIVKIQDYINEKMTPEMHKAQLMRDLLMTLDADGRDWVFQDAENVQGLSRIFDEIIEGFNEFKEMVNSLYADVKEDNAIFEDRMREEGRICMLVEQYLTGNDTEKVRIKKELFEDQPFEWGRKVFSYLSIKDNQNRFISQWPQYSYDFSKLYATVMGWLDFKGREMEEQNESEAEETATEAAAA